MKRLSLLWLVIAVAALGLGAISCSDDDTNPTTPGPTEFEQLATLGDTYFTAYTTQGGLPVNVVASAVYANVTDGNTANDPHIIDWRTAEHFALGHIDGAVNVPMSGANIANVIAAIPDGKTVLNVCYTGQTASYVTAYMNMLGVEAQNLKFGMCGWTGDAAVNLGRWDTAVADGDDHASWMVTASTTSATTYAFPTLSTGKTVPEEILAARGAAIFTTGFKTITDDALHAAFDAGNTADYFVINYFPSTEYNAGHIPGAVRFEPKQDLDIDVLLDTIPTGKKVVVYCYTGQTSAQVVCYLNMLGYDAYSLTYGVNSMCYSNASICVPANQYHAAATNYPVEIGM